MPRSRSLAFLAAFTAIVAALVLAARPAPPSANLRPRFDEPDAAARYAERRRAPIQAGRSGAQRPIEAAALYDAAAARVARMRRFSSRISRPLPAAQPAARVWPGARPAGVLDAWTPLGPGNIGGRTRIVRFHPSNHDTLFAAGVSGGIWRSDDAGESWRPIADGLTNIAINAFAIDRRSPDTMYAGTGEGYFREEIRGTGLPLRGGGIFVTRDGGGRWTRLASTAGADFHWVNDLEISESDSRRLYAATRTGVWRSTNGGEMWTKLLGTEVRGGCLDLALRTDDPQDILFASCGSYEQAIVYRFPRAASDARSEVVLAEPDMGRTSLALAPSDQRIMYALAASNAPGPGDLYQQGLLAVYRSDRSGAAGTWEARVRNTDPTKLYTLLLTNASPAVSRDCSTNPNAQNAVINMGWYVNVIAVDPRDPNRVWAAGVDWFRSDDGGRTWGLSSSMNMPRTPANTPAHVDQHAIAFHPRYDGQGNQTVLIGNDGGVYRSLNARARTATGPRAACGPVSMDIRWESLNRGLGITQFYHGVPFPDGERFVAGAQDNGTILGAEADGPDGWRPIFGGDGSYAAVDSSDTRIMYVQSQWGNIAKTVNGGQNFTGATRGLDPLVSDNLGPDGNFLFVTPLLMDPRNRQRLWTGGDYIYRTDNGAALWAKASTALPDGGLTSALAVSDEDSRRVVAGTTKGDILVNTNALQANAGTLWRSERPRDGWVTSVAFDPRNANVVYATYGNFGGPHVFRSRNGGQTWESIDGDGDEGLPDIPVHSIVIDPDDADRLYLGTDLGVMVSIEGGQFWMIEETGFGPAVTEWLSLIRDTAGRKRLFAFTHGRGAWRVELR